ncbi:MAG: hypothetical protein QXY62_00270 [Candidatus Altiarchaeota archaeon]
MATVKKGWKEKKIYRIIAPDSFNQQEIGATFSSDEKKLIGRNIEVSLRDLTDDKTKQHIKVVFEIFNVENGVAKTKFKKFYTSAQYSRSKIKKGISKIETKMKLKLLDANIWLRSVIATNKKIQTSKATDMNKKAIEIIEKNKDMKFNDFLHIALFGKLASEIYYSVKKISPVKRVEIEELRLI